MKIFCLLGMHRWRELYATRYETFYKCTRCRNTKTIMEEADE